MSKAKVEPKYRRSLNEGQLDVLNILHSFRFATSEQIAKNFNYQNSMSVYKKLTILTEQGYIGKRYDKSYRLKGRPVEYYLTPSGARLLRDAYEIDITDQFIKNLYKDKTASDKFILHCISIFTLYLQLYDLYGDKLDFYTRAELNIKTYDYFPKPIADAFITIRGGAKGTGRARYFFMDVFEDDIPFFVLIARIKKYLAFIENGGWSDTSYDFPTILMVCESPRRLKQLLRRIAKELRDSYEGGVKFVASTKELLATGNAWQVTEEEKKLNDLNKIY